MPVTSILLSLAVVSPEEFTLTLPVSPETPQGQQLVAERAIAICAGRYPQLGRYRFTGEERTAPDGTRESRFEVRQELRCLDAPPTASAVPPAPPDWQPTQEDERQVRGLTERYFAFVDSVDAEQVHRLWSADQQAETPVSERGAALVAFHRQAGTPGDHRIVALTWYVNPQNAPVPGIYAAVDYERSYSGLHLNCGYLIWFREAADRYVLIREETNIFARGEEEATPESLAQARALMRCEGR